MKIQFTIFFLSIFGFCFGQKMNTVKAQILSLSDSSFISYAHIGIPYYGIGTISNIAGEFEWNINCSNDDTIYISHICFETKEIQIRNLIKDSVIYLMPREINLTQINVYSEERLNEIFSKVLKNIPKNYPSKLHYMQGFYREIQYSKSTKNSTRLIEAAFNIQDKGYRSNLNNIRLDLIKLRKSTNFSKKNLFNNILERIFPEDANFLFTTIKTDPIRSYFPFTRDQLKNVLIKFHHQQNIEYSFVEEIDNNKKKFLKIGYSIDGFSSYSGYIIVNTLDYSISELYYRLSYKENTIAEYTIKYHAIEEKYYPIYISYTHISDIRKDNKGTGTNGMSINTIIFTNHYTQRSEFDKIKRKFDLKSDGDLYNQEFEYDSVFWDNYNILLEEPLDMNVEKDLTKTRSLQDQFKNPKQ